MKRPTERCPNDQSVRRPAHQFHDIPVYGNTLPLSIFQPIKVENGFLVRRVHLVKKIGKETG